MKKQTQEEIVLAALKAAKKSGHDSYSLRNEVARVTGSIFSVPTASIRRAISMLRLRGYNILNNNGSYVLLG